MASNQIQFQHGMSIPEFLRSFGAEAIKAVRWPEGFQCLRCASSDRYVVDHGARQLFQRNGCQHQTSLTAGSLMPGGERAGVNVGRGSENKTPFFAAVSVNDHGHSVYIELNVVRGYTSAAISKWSKVNLLPGASVHRDGLGWRCSGAVADAGCLPLPMVVGSFKPRDLVASLIVDVVRAKPIEENTGRTHAEACF